MAQRAASISSIHPVQTHVNIRPGVSVLSVLRHLNYKPWYALAEFVDNSLQSFLAHRAELQRVDGRNARVRVAIDINKDDDGRITIRDNAAGIHERDYARAFRAAEVPPDRTGLSEFGMGMKSAACWFAPRWFVRTKALDETFERTVTFDIKKIIKDSVEELDVVREKAKPEHHFTEVGLENVYRIPQGRTLGRIKDHLASIYRVFLREEVLELVLNGEPLEHEIPKVLSAPFFKTPKAKARTWRKPIDFKLSGGRRVHGFAALRAKASTAEAGFALLRRKRLIQGSGDEGYRPHAIFGNTNSYRYQRLFGELELEGFEVSHTKDGFKWDDIEQEFFEKLQAALDKEPLPLLKQAEGYRARPTKEDLQKAAESVVTSTADVLESGGGRLVERAIELGVEDAPPESLRKAVIASRREVSLTVNGVEWILALEATDDQSARDWVEVQEKKGSNRLGIRMALVHPFTERFAGVDSERLEPLMRIAAAIGLAEITARRSGIKMVGTLRTHLNELLRAQLSNP